MTATNMCSNFGGKWDSPSVVQIVYLRKKLRITKKVFFSQQV